MIDWDEHAGAIVARLKSEVGLLATVLHLQDAETENNPATLPAAYVVMAKTDFTPQGTSHNAATIKWQVLVRCKRMTGETGALLVSKQVIRQLSGFQIGAGMSPLDPVDIGFFREEMRPEPAYLITFVTTSDQIQNIFNNC